MALSTDPINLLLDDDGDIVVDGGLQFATGLTAVRQAIRFRLGLFKGEWFLNLDEGVPWWQEILGHKPTLARVRDILRRAIIGTPSVVEISSLEVELDQASRTLSASFHVVTEFGDLEDDITVEV